jgi:hypothetical protein
MAVAALIALRGLQRGLQQDTEAAAGIDVSDRISQQ